jgi:hypothetical protein
MEQNTDPFRSPSLAKFGTSYLPAVSVCRINPQPVRAFAQCLHFCACSDCGQPQAEKGQAKGRGECSEEEPRQRGHFDPLYPIPWPLLPRNQQSTLGYPNHTLHTLFPLDAPFPQSSKKTRRQPEILQEAARCCLGRPTLGGVGGSRRVCPFQMEAEVKTLRGSEGNI